MEKFEPQLVAFDDYKEGNLIGAAEKEAERINGIFKKVDEFLEVKPTKQKRQQLLDSGYGYLMEEIRGKFLFPKATDKWNLESMGLDPEPFKDLLKDIDDVFTDNHLSLEGVEVKLTDRGREAIKKDCTIMTLNQNGNDKLKFAKALCDFLEEYRVELGTCCEIYKNPLGVNSAKKVFKDMVLILGDGEEAKYVPNPRRVTH